jgi:DUF2075 family protein
MFKKGENQIKEIIKASSTSVFFVDPHQQVTFLDIGSEKEIQKWADHYGANVTLMNLPSQFRCSGSDGYLAWLDSSLEIDETANLTLDDDYDFRIYSNPCDMRDEIMKLNSNDAPARVLAGYCWKWLSKADPAAFDIVFKEFGFKAKWNDFDLGQSWIIHEESVNQIGCIHTAQGLEAAYVGVIIGPDLTCENGVLQTHPLEHPGTDKNFSGLRSMIKNNQEGVYERSHQLILNTYRTLLTRGMKGCFVYCTDEGLRSYLAEKAGRECCY